MDSKEHKECERRLSKAISSNKHIQLLVESLKGLGCNFATEKGFFSCQKCEMPIFGAFGFKDLHVEGKSSQPLLFMCENQRTPHEAFEATIIHELIHAYDYCKSAETNIHNCEYHACTEIRAASLSGDCAFKLELLRGNLALPTKNNHISCVKRRAELSISLNPSCKGREKESVNRVFDRCYSDIQPFSESSLP